MITAYIALAGVVVLAAYEGFKLRLFSILIRSEFQKVATELQTVADKATADALKASNDINAEASKVARTISRKVCSICHRMVWQFDEYADGTIICTDCVRRGVVKRTPLSVLTEAKAAAESTEESAEKVEE
jgi:hypothetical protein